MAFVYPDNLRYTDTHEYINLNEDIATVGITAFAIDQLGDIVFLELPEEGDEVVQGEKFGTIESVKAVEDLKAPVTGTVVAVNSAMVDAPENLADDPYVDGWLIKIEVEDVEEVEAAMTATVYSGMVEGQ
ncbi:MAG: glycine cleavage system protein GcvH [Alkalinema sp. FL-bin-369]|jgi:glycine cleavage system H protein|nr:glycine cleavage system protein GcvH [Leptolyngbyaceae cyanobacterium LF-bin-369]